MSDTTQPIATPLMVMPMLTESFKPVITPAMTSLISPKLNLAALRMLTVDLHVKNAPVVTSDPVRPDAGLTGADGTSYFVPYARVSKRSKASSVKNIFFERTEGKVVLRVWFDIARPDSVASDAQPLPVDSYAVALVDSTGTRINFTRCDELPAGEVADGLVSQLICETEVDPNQVVSIMQEDRNARFDVQGTVHYGLGAAATPAAKPVKPPVSRPVSPNIGARLAARLKPGALRGALSRPRRGELSLTGNPSAAKPPVVNPVTFVPLIASLSPVLVPPATTAPPQQKSKRMSLALATGTEVSAHFPTSVSENRVIYAQVTSGFGSEPWSTWARTTEGQFTDSPVPDQFYILPDEYRLAFDAETGLPSMSVILVPPEEPTADAPMSFARDYGIRCRFGVVPFVDPARRERLRAEITRHTGVAYPELLVGGVSSAEFKLSNEHAGLGASLVGGIDAVAEVDAFGFSLVLDCNSQFYTLLSSLLTGGGVGGEVALQLLDSDDDAQQAAVPVRLQLNRPALDFISAEMIEPARPVAADAGGAAVLAGPNPPRLRISNPSGYELTIGEVHATLLVVDDTLPSPLDAVPATANPSTVTLPGAVDGTPASVEIDLTADDTSKPTLYGGIGVGLIAVDVNIDAASVLNRVHDLGGSADMETEVELQSYQLAHPDILPESHADVFGIELQLARASADPITVFLTRDQPAVNAQVAFTLRDALEGASPEQPTFSWRRRNMAGSGTGEWSDWEEMTGRQLFVSPTGL